MLVLLVAIWLNKMVDEQKIQEMQILEQKLQNTILQKQAFQMELAETDSALIELEKAGDEVFKIIGQLMLKSDKLKIKEELIDKQKMLQLRISTFEKQEKFLTEQLEKFRDEISKS
jgi:prefoldin beta subunit